MSSRETAAARDVLAERERQKASEGWSLEHDDGHRSGELARAAAVYALHSVDRPRFDRSPEWRAAIFVHWPWTRNWLKLGDARRDLVKAGALILAEIERLDRAEASSSPEGEGG